MTDNLPQNIVEAYKNASQAALMFPKESGEAYEKVIEFCKKDADCVLDKTLKRNTLLFWAYNNVAEKAASAERYEQAIDNWLEAAELSKDVAVKIELGQKMLEAANLVDCNIPQKAQYITKISLLLQQTYLATGDEKAAEKMARLNDTANYLLNNSNRKH